MIFRFEVVVKNGVDTLVTLEGKRALMPKDITAAELLEIPELECKLEKLTGYRFHINQVG